MATAAQDAAEGELCGDSGEAPVRAGRVSVITPIADFRQDNHEAIWKCFDAQLWPDKELVVVETYSFEPSQFFADVAQRDTRVVYRSFKQGEGEHWNTGRKRNLCIRLSTGEFIVHFDDGELYAPGYLDFMVRHLEDPRVQLVTLSSWFALSGAACGFCDPVLASLTGSADASGEEVWDAMCGRGFSFVYRRSAVVHVQFEDVRSGENLLFVAALRRWWGDEGIASPRDTFGICLQRSCVPAFMVRSLGFEEAHDLDIAELAPHFRGAHSGNCTLLQAVLASAEPPSTRHRLLSVHLADGETDLYCAVNVTVAELLGCLQEDILCLGEPCDDMEVYCVPPADFASEEVRDKVALDVLGLPAGGQWRQLLEEARRPLPRHARIGLSISKLWVCKPRQEPAWPAPGGGVIVVHVSYPPSKRCPGWFRARLPLGTCVEEFRSLLLKDLPLDAEVRAEGSVLEGADLVPECVSLSSFRGRYTFYGMLTHDELNVGLDMLEAFWLKPESQRKLREIEEASRDNELQYTLLRAELLGKEAFPPIVRHLGLPEEEDPVRVIAEGFLPVGKYIDISSKMVRVSLLARFSKEAFETYDRLCALLQERGLPPPHPPWAEEAPSVQDEQAALLDKMSFTARSSTSSHLRSVAALVRVLLTEPESPRLMPDQVGYMWLNGAKLEITLPSGFSAPAATLSSGTLHVCCSGGADKQVTLRLPVPLGVNACASTFTAQPANSSTSWHLLLGRCSADASSLFPTSWVVARVAASAGGGRCDHRAGERKRSLDVLYAQAQGLVQLLRGPGWGFVDGFLRGGEADALHLLVRDLWAAGWLGAKQSWVPRGVRGDVFSQGELGACPEPLRTAQERINLLASELCRKVPALHGRVECEPPMFAVYPGSGARYQCHMDWFAAKGIPERRRVCTLILYLNPFWDESHGGQLRLYPYLTEEASLLGPPLESEPSVQVEPLHGRLLAFLCEGRNAHEVLPAWRARFAVTWWVRTLQGSERSQ